MTRAGAVARIDALLGTVSNPTFKLIYFGEPLSVPTTPMCAFWIQSHDLDFETLGDVSTTTTMTIQAYFPVLVNETLRETVEQDVWDAIVNIKTALRGDTDLNGQVTDSEIGSATTGFLDLSGNRFRVATIPFEIDMFGEYPITP